jgi:hypothetical protein
MFARSIVRRHSQILRANRKKYKPLHQSQRCFSNEASTPPTISRRGKLDFFLIICGSISAWLYVQNSDWDQDVRDAKQRLISLAEGKALDKDNAFSKPVQDKDLPLPLKRYLKKSIKDRRLIKSSSRASLLASAKQSGEFFASQDWYPFTASLLLLGQSPGFVWESHVNILKMPNRVLQTFIEDKGSITTKAWGKVPLIQVEEEEPYVLFWLAMSPLIPFVLLRDQNDDDENRYRLSWSSIHDLDTCTGQLYDKSQQKTFFLELEFCNDTSLLKSIKVTSSILPQPWQATFKDYVEEEGLYIPTVIEVGKWFENDLRLHLKLMNRQLKLHSK